MTVAHIEQMIRMRYANAPNHSSQWGPAPGDEIDGSRAQLAALEGNEWRAAVTEEGREAAPRASRKPRRAARFALNRPNGGREPRRDARVLGPTQACEAYG